MKAREFDIVIQPDGTVEVQVKGYKGRSCLEAAKLFEEIVGQTKAQEATSEMYEPEEQVQYKIEHRR